MASSSRVPNRLLALALLALASAPAFGEDDADEQIVVWGEAEVARRRAELEQDLEAQGYYDGKRKGDKVVYRPRVPWKPTVEVYDDGFVILKRSPVRFGVPREVNPLWNLACPLAPHVCVRIGGQMVSKRKLDAVKAKVLEESTPELRAWQDAITEGAMATRLNEEVPALLDRAWRAGVDFDGVADLPDPAARRRAIAAFWAGRSCTGEGDEVRAVVELFLREEVQTSPHPLTEGEIAEAEAANRCGGRRLLGDGD